MLTSTHFPIIANATVEGTGRPARGNPFGEAFHPTLDDHQHDLTFQKRVVAMQAPMNLTAAEINVRINMTYSLDPVSPDTLKAEARALREDQAGQGNPMSLAQALEATAKSHGYRDWNTVVGSLKEPLACPVQLGQRVTGKYLKQNFAGTVLSLTTLPGGKYSKIAVHFDQPVDVVTFDSFSAFRSRVHATIDAYGRSPTHTSDGEPHMQLDLAHLKKRR